MILAPWNVDDVLRYLAVHGAEVGEDNDGQIVLYTGLFAHTDGTLHTEPENS